MIVSKIGWWYPSSGGKGSFFYRNILWKSCSHCPALLAVGLTPSFRTGTGYVVSVELEDILLIRICKEIKTSTETQFHPICVKNKFTTGNTPQEMCFSWLLNHTREIQPMLSSGFCKHSSSINWMENAKCLCGLKKKKNNHYLMTLREVRFWRAAHIAPAVLKRRLKG